MLRAALLLAAMLFADAVVPDWDGIAPPARPTRLEPYAGALFLGTESGLYRRGAADAGGWSLALASEPILDLAATARELLVATPAGLFAWSEERASAERVALGAGAEPRGLCVDASGTAWVATASGLFRRGASEREFAREQSLPPGEIAAVASAGAEVWAALEGELWSGSAERGFARRLAGLDAGWWELRGAAAGAGATLLGVADGVWRVDPAGATRVELGIGELYRLARAGDRIYAAAERGLYAYSLAELGAGGGRQALSGPALALGVAADRLLVATERGLAAFAPGPAVPPEARARAPRAVDHAPRIAALRRAVLEYQELAPERTAEIERRARWRGLYPELRASGGLDRDGDWSGAHDETFSSGALHDLSDWDRSHHHGYDAAVSLVWELSDLASPDDALAVSRERRLVVSLRDQVLERVNHLYFQRVRVLAQLDALSPGETARRAELELAAAEIAAQLDAWSGGAFSRLEHDSPLEDQREPR